jgi:hypothetical protein
MQKNSVSRITHVNQWVFGRLGTAALATVGAT